MTPAFRLETLRLAQFRSYARAEVATGGESVALFGPNGSGKTNLLEAVSLLVPGRGLRRAAPEELARRALGVGWRLSAEVASPEGPAEIVTGVEAGGRRNVEIDGAIATQTALGRHMRQIWLTPAMDRLWSDAPAERRRFLDRMTLGFAPDHGTDVAGYERAMRERGRLLKDGMLTGPWLDGLEAQMARLGARIARARAGALAAVTAAQGAAETAFPRAELEILGPLEAAFAQATAAEEDLDLAEAREAAALSRALGIARPADAAAGRALSGPHRSDLGAVYAAKEMPAAACSTGEQKALLISLCLSNARALAVATGAAPVLLLDEVAAHLDTGRRAALYGEIAALGAQAWMTGTGPELFDALPQRTLRIRVEETPEGSALATG